LFIVGRKGGSAARIVIDRYEYKVFRRTSIECGAHQTNIDNVGGLMMFKRRQESTWSRFSKRVTLF